MGHWIYDASTRMFHWSKEVFLLHGVSPDTFRPDLASVLELLQPEDQDRFTEAVSTDGYQLNYRIVLPDQQSRWITVRGDTLTYDGKSLHLATVNPSPDEHHDLKKVLELSSEALILVDRERRIVNINEATTELLGYQLSELSGQKIEVLIPEDLAGQHHDLANAYLEKPVRKKMASRSRLVARSKTGEHIPVEIDLSPVSHGGSTLILASLTDARDQKSLEEQLRQSQKIEALGQLAGGIAHDMNNILTAIIGFADMAQNQYHDNYSREILHASERASALIDQLLSFTRQQVLQPEIVDINRIIAGMEKMLKPLIKSSIRLSTRLDPMIGLVGVDPGHREQVILNLVINSTQAIAATGTIQIETTMADLEELQTISGVRFVPGRYVLLTVNDSGSGIAEEAIKNIFDPFFTTKEPGHGTGLGLSVVYGIIKQSHGYITVESDDRIGGTTFTIYLPVTDKRPATGQTTKPARTTNRKTANILLVEDDDMVRKLTRTVLEKQGFSVTEVQDGESAIRKLSSGETGFDLVISDLVLPGINGQVLATEIIKERPDIEILLVSGYRRGEETITTIDDRINFLAKPYRPGELIETVSNILG